MTNYVLTIDGTTYSFQSEREMGNYKFNLEKLTYDKGIYRPAEIKVTMNVSGQNVKNSDLVSAFHQKIVKLTIDDEPVADDYFVFNVKPIFKKVSNESSVKLELTIYSRDKLLTLDKYSKAWSGRKLGTDIFTNEVNSFNLGIQTCKNLQVVEYNKGGTNEFVQPYLVQYNESFYDFLRRTANRCGEFLYHENGQLHLGMQMTDKAGNSDPDYAQVASERYYENILQEGVETSDYSYNYFSNNRIPRAKKDEEKKEPSKPIRPYSDPLPYDDYLQETKKEFTTMAEQMDFLSRNIMSGLITILNGKTLTEIVSNWAVALGFKAIVANAATVGLNDKNKTINIDPWAEKNDQKNGDSLVRQFATYNDKRPKNDFCGKDINMNAAFFALMREAEKKVGENAVYLEFGADAQKLSIGDKIKVDGENYVVIGVNGSCEYIQVVGLVGTSSYYEERQQVIGVKLYSDAAIPPALPDIVVRESQPQLAFVVDNFDPEKLGRVRVKFAWQPVDETNDNKDDASPWIRVALPFATDGGGIKFKLEKGDEVMVNFEGGNVERPYVSGSLLSPQTNKAWSWLPDRTITSKNGHNITFNDSVDGASFFYALSPALKSLKSFIPTSTWEPCLSDNDICRSLSGGMTISDRFGLYNINLSSSSRTVTIQSSVGDVKINALTGITISSPNGDVKIEGKNVSIAASNTVTIESGKAVKDRFFYEEDCYAEDGLKWYTRLGRSSFDAIAGGVRGALTRSVGVVVDVQLVRSFLDLLLRPIDGTTKIKSFTFVQVEAGKGSAEYPREARKADEDEHLAFELHKAIKDAAAAALSKVEAIQSAFGAVYRCVQEFKNYSGEEGINRNQSILSLDSIKDASFKEFPSPLNLTWPQIKTKQQLKDEYDNELAAIDQDKPKKEDYKDNLNQFKLAEEKIKERKKNAERRYNEELTKYEETMNTRNLFTDVSENLYMSINTLYRTSNDGFKSNIQAAGTFDDILIHMFNGMAFPDLKNNITIGMAKDGGFGWANQKKHFMRAAVATLLTNGDLQKKVNHYNFLMDLKPVAIGDNLQDEVTWGNLVHDLVKEDCRNWVTKDLRKYKDWACSTYKDIWDQATNRKRWAVGVKGKILLSDDSQTTLSFDDKGQVKATENVTFTDKNHKKMRKFLKSIGTNVK